jgi:hypothetical protein
MNSCGLKFIRPSLSLMQRLLKNLPKLTRSSPTQELYSKKKIVLRISGKDIWISTTLASGKLSL